MADKRIVTVDYLNSEGLNKDYINNTFANALKGSKSGSAILIDDVSPVTHEMRVRVRGKNLIPYPYFETTKTVNGVTFTDNEDGTITVNGTATANITYVICQSSSVTTQVKLTSGCTYTLSGCPSGGGSNKYLLRTGGTKSYADHGSNISFTATSDYTNAGIVIQIMNGVTVENLVFKPQIELGTTATAYTPYVSDLTAVKVSRCGKNLFSGLTKGVGINSNNGSETTDSKYASSDYIPVDFNTNTNYYISGLPTTISNYVAAYNANKEFLGRTGGNAMAEKRLTKTQFANGTPQGTGDIAYLRVTCYVVSSVTTGTIDDIDDCNIQLEIGSTATDYEPYNSATFTPTADGTVEGVTSLYPNTTLTTDTNGVMIDCEYNRDINKAFAALEAAIVTNS